MRVDDAGLDTPCWFPRSPHGSRLDNVGIVVEDLAPVIEFFRELGLELEGRSFVMSEWQGASPAWTSNA